MSIIAFKVYEKKIVVVSDGLIVSGDKVINKFEKKIYKMSDRLIIGVTGLNDSKTIFRKFVQENLKFFENVHEVVDLAEKMKDFLDYLRGRFGFTDGTLKELGGFLIVNPNLNCVYYYDDNLTPYEVAHESDAYSFGACKQYVDALLDIGYSPQEAIKVAAEKYTTINDNLTILEINIH